MIISTTRFGEITIADDKIIYFDEGLLGFEKLKRYALVTMDRLKPFHFLQAVDDAEIALSVINVLEVIDNYSPLINNCVFDAINLEDDADLIVLAAVVLPTDLTKMTANLAAPILINTHNNRGVQAVLEHDEYEMRYRIFEYLSTKGKGADVDVGNN